jgi:hypothetical protein
LRQTRAPMFPYQQNNKITAEQAEPGGEAFHSSRLLPTFGGDNESRKQVRLSNCLPLLTNLILRADLQLTTLILLLPSFELHR